MDHCKSKLYRTLLALMCIAVWDSCLFVGIARAAQSSSGQPASPTADMTAATFKMLASLALIIGVIIVVFYLLKRLRSFSTVSQGGPSMRIVSSLPIAPKRSVTVVEVGDKWLVLGVGTDNINLLSTMEPAGEAPGKNHSPGRPGGSFQRILQAKKLLLNQALRSGHRQ